MLVLLVFQNLSNISLFVSCKQAHMTPVSTLTKLAHLLSVDRPGNGICRTFLKYRYAFGLTDRNDIAFAISSGDHIIRFFECGFRKQRICPGVNDFPSSSNIFASKLVLFFSSFSSYVLNLFCADANCC